MPKAKAKCILSSTCLSFKFSNVFFNSDIENSENGTDNKNNNFKFLRVVALLSITDFAFSIDSITTAVAISDQYILIIFGAVIGVLALRFTSGIFLNLVILYYVLFYLFQL